MQLHQFEPRFEVRFSKSWPERNAFRLGFVQDAARPRWQWRDTVEAGVMAGIVALGIAAGLSTGGVNGLQVIAIASLVPARFLAASVWPRVGPRSRFERYLARQLAAGDSADAEAPLEVVVAGEQGIAATLPDGTRIIVAWAEFKSVDERHGMLWLRYGRRGVFTLPVRVLAPGEQDWMRSRLRDTDPAVVALADGERPEPRVSMTVTMSDADQRTETAVKHRAHLEVRPTQAAVIAGALTAAPIFLLGEWSATPSRAVASVGLGAIALVLVFGTSPWARYRWLSEEERLSRKAPGAAAEHRHELVMDDLGIIQCCRGATALVPWSAFTAVVGAKSGVFLLLQPCSAIPLHETPENVKESAAATALIAEKLGSRLRFAGEKGNARGRSGLP